VIHGTCIHSHPRTVALCKRQDETETGTKAKIADGGGLQRPRTERERERERVCVCVCVLATTGSWARPGDRRCILIMASSSSWHRRRILRLPWVHGAPAVRGGWTSPQSLRLDVSHGTRPPSSSHSFIMGLSVMNMHRLPFFHRKQHQANAPSVCPVAFLPAALQVPTQRQQATLGVRPGPYPTRCRCWTVLPD